MKYWKLLYKAKTLCFFVIAICVIVFFLKNKFANLNEPLHIVKNNKIEITQSEIRKIREIGEWEFLNVHAEQLVESSKKSLLHTSQIVLIYNGTLRIGLNMRELPIDWFRISGDSVKLTLPRIKLLDKNFIDEAKTKVFYEDGLWSAEEKEKLYSRAQYLMIKKVLTPENFAKARQNATAQISKLFFNLGYSYVFISYK